MTAQAGVVGSAPEVKMEPIKKGIEKGGERPSEQKIYEEMWANHPNYRVVSPGEEVSHLFLQQAKPKPGSTILDIGCGTGRGSLNLALFGGLRVHMLDFVPAHICLDEDIRPMLETQKQSLTFSQCDITKDIPYTAQYGFCTDVMEHIPTDKVGKTIDACLRAVQHMFFMICLEDDVCGEAIGHALHLTVKPYEWWLERFNERGVAIHWSKNMGRNACFYVSAYEDAQKFTESGECNVEDTVFRDNVIANIKGDWKQVSPHEANDLEVLLLGGGPSLKDFEQDIRDRHAKGAKIVTLNGAYNWCMERGIGPVTQIMVDARPFNARFVKPISDKNMYLIASQCDPAVLEGLPKERTYLWHTSAEIIDPVLNERYKKEGWWTVPGGSTVMLRSLMLLRMLGYQKLHMYGCDSCLSDEKVHHAYSQPENDTEVIVRVAVPGNGRIFFCHPWMAAQAQEFISTIKQFGDMLELEVYGDGLLAHILKCGADVADVEDAKLP